MRLERGEGLGLLLRERGSSIPHELLSYSRWSSSDKWQIRSRFFLSSIRTRPRVFLTYPSRCQLLRTRFTLNKFVPAICASSSSETSISATPVLSFFVPSFKTQGPTENPRLNRLGRQLFKSLLELMSPAKSNPQGILGKMGQRPANCWMVILSHTRASLFFA